MNWSVIVLLPVAFVLLNGLLIFVLITLSTGSELRRPILVVATAGAVVVCAVVFMVMAVVFRRPMLELQEKIAMVRLGDLHAMVEFATRNDDIGDLGRDFNAMVRQLRESREEIQHLHRTQMSRAEHLATLGELAAGLAHEIRNPLAGIAGVIEIVGRDLPKESPAQNVLKDVRTEVAHINRIVTDLLEIARPKAPVFSRFDVVATTEQALLFAREQAMAKSISLEIIKNDPHSSHRTRHRADSAGIAELAVECHPGMRRKRQREGRVRAGRGIRLGGRYRYRPGDFPRDAAEYLSSVFHHQGQRNRPRAAVG